MNTQQNSLELLLKHVSTLNIVLWRLADTTWVRAHLILRGAVQAEFWSVKLDIAKKYQILTLD